MLQLFNYNAGAGDCIRIRFDGHNIIIDSGTTRFGPGFRRICNEIRSAGEAIDALILTHSDADHIGGLLHNLRLSVDLPIQEVWMNHGRASRGDVDLSVRQNDEVYALLLKKGISVLPAVSGIEREVGNARCRILAPDEVDLNACYPDHKTVPLSVRSDYNYSMAELMDKPIRTRDTSPSNKVSIVFEFAYDEIKMLFTGDALPEDIVKKAAPFYDLIKLPHHGSVRNISEEWRAIQCRNFMICTDGLQHPDKQTIAKLIKWNDDAKFYVSGSWWRKLLGGDDGKYQGCFVEGEEYLWERERIR